MTSLEPDELLTAIEYPAVTPRTGWSFNEFSRRSGDFALVGCAVVIEVGDDGVISEARIGLSGDLQRPRSGF